MIEVNVTWKDGTKERLTFRGYQELVAWAALHHGEYQSFETGGSLNGPCV